MELPTFSIVLRYTLRLEDQTAQFYRNLEGSNKLAQAKELFTKLADSSDRRRKDLERTARESVDHSLLEPVSAIFEEVYSVNTTLSNGASISDAISAAKTL